MVHARTFLQVDVFGSSALAGNPLAVVVDAQDIDDATMQRFAQWTNLSETAFLLPPTTADADYRVRIFTPARELPFAGHPTLGACHAWLASGGRPQHVDRVVQECGVGLVTVRRGETLAFAAPPLVRSGPVDTDDRLRTLQMLQLSTDDVADMAWVDNGPGWLGVLVHDVATLHAMTPDSTAISVLSSGTIHLGVAAPVRQPGIDLEVRAVFPDDSGAFREDPVTGSLNASLAQWLIGAGVLEAPYVARQGTCIGRDGRVYVTRDEDTIWVGGATVTVIDGTVLL